MVRFYTKSEIYQIQNDPITMREWVHERDQYTRIQLLTKYFTSRKYIFVIEAQKLKIEASNTQEFFVVVRNAVTCILFNNSVPVCNFTHDRTD